MFSLRFPKPILSWKKIWNFFQLDWSASWWILYGLPEYIHRTLNELSSVGTSSESPQVMTEGPLLASKPSGSERRQLSPSMQTLQEKLWHQDCVGHFGAIIKTSPERISIWGKLWIVWYWLEGESFLLFHLFQSVRKASRPIVLSKQGNELGKNSCFPGCKASGRFLQHWHRSINACGIRGGSPNLPGPSGFILRGRCTALI